MDDDEMILIETNRATQNINQTNRSFSRYNIGEISSKGLNSKSPRIEKDENELSNSHFMISNSRRTKEARTPKNIENEVKEEESE